MEKTGKSRKPLIIAAIVFVVLVVAGIVIWQVAAPKGTAGDKAYTLTVVDAEGDETVHELQTDEEMLGSALLKEGLIEATTVNTAFSSTRSTASRRTRQPGVVVPDD